MLSFLVGTTAFIGLMVYFIVLEGRFGSTPGKWLLGLRVLKEDGTRIGYVEAIIRNIPKVVGNSVFIVIDALLMLLLFNKEKQRGFDKIARTIVVHKRQEGGINLPSVVKMTDVRKSYMMGKSPLQVLKGVNIDIQRGEFVSIMGPSGSGKSTMMNLIGLLDRPTSGEIEINGKKISLLNDVELSTLRGKEIGFIFQSFNLVSRLSALKNVEMPMIFQGSAKQQRTATA